MDYIEKTVKKNYIYQGKILTLRKDDALLPDGTPCIREIIEHSGGACALYIENGKTLETEGDMKQLLLTTIQKQFLQIIQLQTSYTSNH